MSGTTKQYCPAGHDTSIVGRDKVNYRCSECRRIEKRRYKANNSLYIWKQSIYKLRVRIKEKKAMIKELERELIECANFRQ